jgi:hypothetical protein
VCCGELVCFAGPYLHLKHGVCTNAIVEMSAMSKSNKAEMRRRVEDELIATETTYVRDMETIIDVSRLIYTTRTPPYTAPHARLPHGVAPSRLTQRPSPRAACVLACLPCSFTMVSVCASVYPPRVSLCYASAVRAS